METGPGGSVPDGPMASQSTPEAWLLACRRVAAPEPRVHGPLLAGLLATKSRESASRRGECNTLRQVRDRSKGETRAWRTSSAASPRASSPPAECSSTGALGEGGVPVLGFAGWFAFFLLVSPGVLSGLRASFCSLRSSGLCCVLATLEVR